MQVTKSPLNLLKRAAAFTERPTGEKYSGKKPADMTVGDLINDTALFLDGAAETGLYLGSGMVGTSMALKGDVAGGLATAITIGQGFTRAGNLAGNAVAKLTGSEQAGRVTRGLTKTALLIGSVVAATSSFGAAAVAFCAAGTLHGVTQIVSDAKGRMQNSDAERQSAPTEMEARNLLDPAAPSEFDAPNLLTEQADSSASLGKLNTGSAPRVLLQT